MDHGSPARDHGHEGALDDLHVDVEGESVHLRVSEAGSSVSTQIARAVGRVLGHPDVEPRFSLMMELGGNVLPPSREDIHTIASLMRVLRERIEGRIALVVSGVGLTTAAHLISFLSDSSFRVFDDRSAATRWLRGT